MGPGTAHLTKQDVLRTLQRHGGEIRSHGVRRLGIFGSFQRDNATPDSDVDLFVVFEPGQATYDHFIDLSDLCESLLQRKVEIVTPESLSPYFGPRILREIEDVLG